MLVLSAYKAQMNGLSSKENQILICLASLLHYSIVHPISWTEKEHNNGWKNYWNRFRNNKLMRLRDGGRSTKGVDQLLGQPHNSKRGRIHREG